MIQIPGTQAPRRTTAATVLCLILTAVTVAATACTPRPDVADEVIGDFLAAVESRDVDAAAQLTDDSSVAFTALDESWSALQAESLDAEVRDIRTDDNVATADYSMAWTLPGDRTFRYDATLTATRTDGDWAVRWRSSVLHPDLGADQHLELRRVEAQVADIVGSDGAVLATPGTTWRVLLDTDEAKKNGGVQGTVDQIARVLDAAHAEEEAIPTIDKAQVSSAALDADGAYSVTTIPGEFGDRVQQGLESVNGVRMNEEPAMVRPDPGFAPDIMSRVTQLVEPELAGEPGWEVVAVNQNASVVRTMERTAAEPSPAVKVSLSRQVQEAAQKAVDTRPNDQAMMVVMRPSTGEVLAVAQTAEADKQGDVALSGQYPPGSTFKVITAAAGVEKEDLTADSTVSCPSTQDIGGRIVTNYNSFSLGDTSMRNAFAQSCNTTFARISTDMAPGELKEEARKFGLGRDYEIPGLTTMTGQVPEGEVMLDRTEAGYGQGLDLASPFGMALVAATAANGRTPVPNLIDTDDVHTLDPDGKDAVEGEPLKPHVLDNLRDMMRAVVTSGSGSAISGAGEVYGKTGEAEINEGSHAWFMGYRGDLAFATMIVLGGGSEHSVAVTQQFFDNLDGE
ncbi:Putative penicillin-binding protein 2 [Corynebacterium glyciniphilum AJ 3170]|uniref:Putative penicillin-binding protein 2 n=1 Tax=Corynebacterium glyciniphilum AJ 3170 TaxID=1404245 RepID=X5DLF2_9CORY|nr:penicillin-binding transpeptidase domain-containing protein [Corynebacterium glyciniphilum]AHW63938.1 Putative penicillin-binding protein 2 [Corynebacterium glyciniphilum AJ 3170]